MDYNFNLESETFNSKLNQFGNDSYFFTKIFEKESTEMNKNYSNKSINFNIFPISDSNQMNKTETINFPKYKTKQNQINFNVNQILQLKKDISFGNINIVTK